MADLTLPSPNAPFAVDDLNKKVGKIDPIWFQKLTALLTKINQDTLSTNGRLTVTATSDTNLLFSYRGSDDVTRTANLTLV